MTTRVQIVYVRGTVLRLLRCLDTLLLHTDWSFTLVANGCTPDEVRRLRAVGTEHGDRVEVCVESPHEVLAHGEILDRRLECETGPYFCFLDSDIFATGPTELSTLFPSSEEAASCACLPIWHDERDSVMPEGYQIVAGRYLRTSDGRVLGCTYLAAYRTQELRDVMRTWGVSLRQTTWQQLPPAVRDELERHDLRCQIYDTAKVANLLIQMTGRPMVFRETPNLVHVGAQSGLAGSSSRLARVARHLIWTRAPAIYGLRWRLRGYGKDESHSLADLARRYTELSSLVDDIAAGAVDAGTRPKWMTAEQFHSVAAVFDGRTDG